MKKLLSAIALFFFLHHSAPAQASSLLAELKNIDRYIQRVTLDDEGLLVVTYLDNNCLATKQLSDATKMRLGYLARTLSDAVVVTDTRAVTCRIKISPFYLYVLSVKGPGESESAPLKEVLTRNACSETTYTHPENANQQRNAEVLKEALWVLAQEVKCNE